jgi:hypothetical protein
VVIIHSIIMFKSVLSFAFQAEKDYLYKEGQFLIFLPNSLLPHSLSDYGREKWIQVRHVHLPLIYKVVRHICRRLVVIFTLIRLDNIWITWQCCIICLRSGRCCMTQKTQLSKIRDYDRHKSRACIDLFLKVTRSSILTIIINRDEIFDYVIFVCYHSNTLFDMGADWKH